MTNREPHAHEMDTAVISQRGEDRRLADRRQGPRRLDDMIASALSLSEFQEIEREYRAKQALKHARLWSEYMQYERDQRRKAAIVTTIIVVCALLFVIGFAFAVATFVGVI